MFPKKIWPALLGLCLLVGCKAEPVYLPVAGKVTVEGKVLPHARLRFVPDAEKGNTSVLEARARVDSTGAYTLETGDKQGCLVGWYKVLIFPMKEPGPTEGPSPPVWLASTIYPNESTTPFSVEVTANPPDGAYDFDLKK